MLGVSPGLQFFVATCAQKTKSNRIIRCRRPNASKIRWSWRCEQQNAVSDASTFGVRFNLPSTSTVTGDDAVRWCATPKDGCLAWRLREEGGDVVRTTSLKAGPSRIAERANRGRGGGSLHHPVAVRWKRRIPGCSSCEIRCDTKLNSVLMLSCHVHCLLSIWNLVEHLIHLDHWRKDTHSHSHS